MWASSILLLPMFQFSLFFLLFLLLTSRSFCVSYTVRQEKKKEKSLLSVYLCEFSQVFSLSLSLFCFLFLMWDAYFRLILFLSSFLNNIVWGQKIKNFFSSLVWATNDMARLGIDVIYNIFIYFLCIWNHSRTSKEWERETEAKNCYRIWQDSSWIGYVWYSQIFIFISFLL